MDIKEQADLLKLKLEHDKLRKHVEQFPYFGEIYQLAVIQIQMSQLRWRIWNSPQSMQDASKRRAKYLYKVFNR